MTKYHQFGAAALREATEITKRISAVLAERAFVRGITIDSPTSKDLDDAFWLERDSETGAYRLSVSIADVGALITQQLTPALDQDAYTRAFTRYFAEGNAPMLPRQLSENHLSLLEGCSRSTITITFSLDADLQPGEPHIALTTLRSQERLSYEEVDHLMAHPQTEVASMLCQAQDLARRLLLARRARGALALYDLAAGWATTEEGILRPLGTEERYHAQVIIQEVMILTNQSLARFFAERGLPALYRNHVAKAIAPERRALLQMLETAMVDPEQINPERMRATMQLCLERARYAPLVEGHFGLNLPVYLHATSPLRRYPDLVNQRILHAVLENAPLPYTKTELEAIAVHINAEEDALKGQKKAHFLREHDLRLRLAIQEAATDQAIATRAYSSLDAKSFHSLLRITAQKQGQDLPAPLEQEVVSRLEEERLGAHDLFTLLLRFQTSGPTWERMKQAALTWIFDHPHHAISLLAMGRQQLGWQAPEWHISERGPAHAKSFQAQVSVKVGEQHYTALGRSASHKDRAKQRAADAILAKITGIAVAHASDKEGDEDPQVHGQEIASAVSGEEEGMQAGGKVSALHAGSHDFSPGSFSSPVLQAISTEEPEHREELERSEPPDQENYKGQLQERAQQEQWPRPIYCLVERAGPSHAPTFTISAKMTTRRKSYSAQGVGKTKVQAERRAACSLLEQLQESEPRPAMTFMEEGKNAVSMLYEMQQKAAIQQVTYGYESLGPPHQKTFHCTCTIITRDERTMAMTGEGKTKKEAAHAAAAQAVSVLAAQDSF